MNEKTNDFRKKLKKEIIKKTIKDNWNQSILAFFFILSCLINSTLLRALTTKNIFDLRPFFFDLIFLLLITIFSFFVRREKRYIYYLIWSVILVAICIINSIYFTYYTSFTSISLIATSIFIKDVGDAVVQNVFEIKDLIYLWQIIFIIYLCRKLSKEKNFKLKENKKSLVKTYSLITVLILIITSLFVPVNQWKKFTKKWNREAIAMTFGIYIYQFNDLFQSLQPGISNLFGYDKATKYVMDYYEENGYQKQVNEYTNIFEGKNIIFIHAESMQKFTMDLSFNGIEMTPNLNKLAREGMFFSNFYSQVGVGTSSDAEFTLNTSLMPSSSGTVFVNYYDREYTTIPKLLKEKDYYIFSMHANYGDFWNRATMHENMGYDKFYDRDYYSIDEKIGLGLSDKSFFKQSIPIIKKEATNNLSFMATMIMLSNHTPFSDLELMDEYSTTWTVNINGQQVVRDYLQNTTLGNYFRSVHYADQAIGEFIEELDAEGLLDNTVIVIYGDHDARLNQKYYDILYNYDPYTDTILTEEDANYIKQNEYTYELNRSVPFIIWTKDKQFNINVDTPMGMIDVLPTLGNMFNFHSDYQLGKDIFNVTDNTVVFANGSYLTKKIYYNSQKNEFYSINGDAIDEKYIERNSEDADSIIQVSNYIITYDLIKQIKEKNTNFNKQ